MMVIVVKDRHVSIDVIMMIALIYGSIKIMMMLAMMEVSPMLATHISSGSQ